MWIMLLFALHRSRYHRKKVAYTQVPIFNK